MDQAIINQAWIRMVVNLNFPQLMRIIKMRMETQLVEGSHRTCVNLNHWMLNHIEVTANKVQILITQSYKYSVLYHKDKFWKLMISNCETSWMIMIRLMTIWHQI